MSVKLRELIRCIRACKTAAEERAVIAKECALIRTAIKDEDSTYRQRNVAKLLFIHMLGYPTQFGQMECLKLIASPKYSDKRVGYLGLTQLVDETAAVVMLVVNSIKMDLNHNNQYVRGLALSALGNISSSEMCTALAVEVDRMLSNTNPYIRKKATMCAMRMVRKAEEIQDKFNAKVQDLISDKNHGVMMAGCCLLIELVRLDPSNAEQFRPCIPSLIKALKNVSTSGYSGNAEYDISGTCDPFLQVKILRSLNLLSSEAMNEELNDALAQTATNTESVKNSGNAVLYESVRTIVSMNAEHGLRVLGVNILGRFLARGDNNLRYVALTVLQDVVNVDLKAVQRHRTTIVECLKDPDISIRKRALDVTYALINEENVKPMMKELLNFLLISDAEFKENLVNKICLGVERFAPNKKWHLDTLIKVMCLAGNYVQDDIRDSFIHKVSSTVEIQAYCVLKLYFSMKESLAQEALMIVGTWCIGEFGDLLVKGDAVGPDSQPIKVETSDVLDLLHEVGKKGISESKISRRGDVIGEYLITSLMKLVTRLPTG
eukprot:GHVL01039197.1.p1 GENE.GHVL01039197.1~~GHVL01039197.1.p1  ORF type:complete len:548 (-),score=69.52 GHVL01039197.1:803-2446(-)